MGLLDNLIGTGIDDPRFAATTQLAQGLLSSPRLMQGLAQGVGGYQQAIAQARAQKAQEEDRQMRLQMQQLQMQQAQAQAEKQKKLEALAGQFARTPQQMALGAEGKGPTNTALTASQGMAPGFDFAGYAQGLAGIDPMAALTMQGALRKETPAPVKVAAGESLWDPVQRRAIYTNPKEQEQTSSLREYLFARDQQGYPGTFQQFQLEQKRAGATKVQVDAGPKAFDNEFGRFAVETFKGQREGAQAAAGVLQSVGEIRKAAQAGAYQGAGAELKLGAAKALGALGMPYDAKTVANSELFSAQANQFVLNSIKSLGANPSNADREFIEKTVPRLQTDPAALPLLLNFMEGKARGQLTSFNSNAQRVQKRADYLPFSLEVSAPEVPPIGGGGALSPAEQQELQRLRAQLGGRKP